MRVLVIDCSPGSKIEDTSMLLKPFIEGVAAAGGECEVFYADKMDIQPCRGCLEKNIFDPHCECRCNDDMCRIYPKLKDSDVWVFAAPAENGNIPHKLVNILDRMSPLFDPDADNSEAESGLQAESGKKGKIVFISTTKSWGTDNFDTILDHFITVSGLFSKEFAGAILRPHFNAFRALNKINKPVVSNILDSVNRSGRAVVLNGKIPSDMLSNIRRELVPKDSLLLEISNFLNNGRE